MKRIFMIPFLVMLYHLTHAQYLPLFKVDSTTWNVNVIGINGIYDADETYTYAVKETNNDTVLLIEPNYTYSFDSVKISVTADNAQAWIYLEPFNKKILVYDMNLSQGDSFKLYYFDKTNIDSTFMIVDTTYTRENRKVITFENNDSFFPKHEYTHWRLSFIEGVGPRNFFLFGNYLNTSMHYPYNIICKQTKDNIEYESYWDEWSYKDCRSVVGIENLVNDINLLYPNPVKDYVYFDISIKKYVLYNDIGRTISEGNTINEKKINLSNLKTGVYFLKIELEDKFKYIKINKL